MDFKKLAELTPKGMPHTIGNGRKSRAKRLRDLEVLANLEGKAALKPGQRFKRFVAVLGKRFQHNVPND